MSVPIDRAQFADRCEKLFSEWNQNDSEMLKVFLLSECGMKTLGLLQREATRTSNIGPMQISTQNPYECTAALAEIKGTVRGIFHIVDLLLETANV